MSADPHRPLSVLVVDDHEEGAQSTAELLRLCGYAVRIATCGLAALHEVAAAMPDVVLLDIGLPDMSGWVVAERMRAQAQGRQPLVVAVTGYAADEDQRRSGDAGIDLHLVKPTDPTALVELLASIHRNLLAHRADLPPGNRS